MGGYAEQGWAEAGWSDEGWADQPGDPVGDSGGAIIVDETDTTSGPRYRRNGTDVVKHTFEWVSDADGNGTLVSGTAVSGQIERVVFIPSDVTAPTASYDVTLTDEDGIDVLSGQGVNLSETVASSVRPGTPLRDGTTVSVISTVVDGLLTLNVSNAGDSKAGRVVVYVR